MSIVINLGAWGSVFAVPSRVVDEDIKIAGVFQLKTLLYILRHSGEVLTCEDIAGAISLNPDDVKDSISFWIERGLLTNIGDELIPQKITERAVQAPIDTKEAIIENTNQNTNLNINTKKSVPLTAQPRPDIQFVSQRLNDENVLAAMMEEAQAVLQKPLSSGEICSLFMLYDSYGLPPEVILMLIQYSVSINRANINAIEKEGIRWSNDGVASIEQAEEKITSLMNRSTLWGEVAGIFGIHLTGTPTKAQLNFAECWLKEWGFSSEMLRIAYEKCVDTKGGCDLRYINGILRKWKKSGITTPEDTEREDLAKRTSTRGGKRTITNSSYDIDSLDDTSLFDE